LRCGTREDDHLGLAIFSHAVDRILETSHQFAVQSVAPGRPVERDGAHAPADLGEDDGFGLANGRVESLYHSCHDLLARLAESGFSILKAAGPNLGGALDAGRFER
jgi:hypothetical protein